jgi:crotonobetainyl-CoA:carnitine CoA-transferase CaiB-like acyl-CoA transferase
MPIETHDMHRGKKSVTLNLKDPTHKNAFLKLVESYDVVIDPYRPGVLEKLGLGVATLGEHNPNIILVRISSFGQTGKLRDFAAHD